MIFLCGVAEGKTLRISNQADMDQLGARLMNLIRGGTRRINIIFEHGLYYYEDNCVLLDGINEPRLSVLLTGKGALLIPKGRVYENGDVLQGVFSPSISVIDIKNEKEVPYWENVRHAESRVELVDEQKGLWRIKCSLLNDATKEECVFSYIILPCWYTSYTLKVDHIKDGYLYFISANKTFLDGYKCYMFDADYGYGKSYPRFKICNYSKAANFSVLNNKHVHLSDNITQVHVCEAGTFLRFNNCRIKYLKIKGLTFLGSSAKSPKSYLLEVSNCKANNIQIINNSFEGMQNTVIGVENTNNIQIERNTIKRCYRSGIFVDNKCSAIQINNNTISYCGLGLKQDLGICVFGGNYHISKNILSNYGYSAINVGMWHGHENVNPSYGVIEFNEIYQTPDYIQNIDNYGLMDAGAIYLSTQNAGAIIRNNYIHDISGMKDNRGIFCDDGARNFTIEGNVIINIYNCYSIDSWRVSSHEDKLGPTNVGNTIQDNIVDGPIRFEANERRDNSCCLGVNYFLTDGQQVIKNSIYRNLDESIPEVFLIKTKEVDDKIFTDHNSLKALKSSSSWKFFNTLIKEDKQKNER